MELFARLNVIISNLVVWITTPKLINEQISHPSEEITITLAVYVTSLVATAISTWTVAKYDSRRSKDIDFLREELNRLRKRFDERTY